MKNLISTYRSLMLLLVITTGMVSIAFSDESKDDRVVLFVANVLLGIGGAYLLGASHRWRISAWVIAVLMILFEILLVDGTRESMFLQMGARVLTMSLVGLMLVVVLKYSLLGAGQTYKSDRILAGISGYLLIALFWSNLFFAIEIVVPGSFTDPSGGEMTRFDFLYFSLTSLTTLGYGDVLPITGAARIFSVLESVSGVLYIAIFISTLIAIPGDKRS